MSSALGTIHANMTSAGYDNLAMEIDELSYSLTATGEAWHERNCTASICTGRNAIHVTGVWHAHNMCGLQNGDLALVLNVELEQQHISILHDILLAFRSHIALLARILPSTISDECVECNCVRLDEAALEVGVDHSGGLRRGIAAMNGPRAHFLLAGSEIRL